MIRQQYLPCRTFWPGGKLCFPPPSGSNKDARLAVNCQNSFRASPVPPCLWKRTHRKLACTCVRHAVVSAGGGRHSLRPYQRAADSAPPLHPIACELRSPLSDVLHGCQVGLRERTAKYKVFIPAVPGWDCVARVQMSGAQCGRARRSLVDETVILTARC